eukprot:scaffold245_cov256-Pinguiococcus_pyrenoidosus.AAC.45
MLVSLAISRLVLCHGNSKIEEAQGLVPRVDELVLLSRIDHNSVAGAQGELLSFRLSEVET